MPIHDQVLSAFQAEHRELLEAIRNLLQKKESGRDDLDHASLDEAFRMAHSFKGGARICNLRDMETLGHHLETLFEQVRRGVISLNADVSGVVMRVLDGIEDWMGELAEGRDAGTPEGAISAIERLLDVQRGDPPNVQGDVEPGRADTTQQEPARMEDEHAPRDEVMRIHAGGLDALLQSAMQLAGETNRLSLIENEARALCRALGTVSREWAAARETCFAGLQSLRAKRDMKHVVRFLDGLDAQLRGVLRQAAHLDTQQRNADWRLQSLGEQLQAHVLVARTVDVASMAQGFRKMVRELAHDLGRKAELTINGGDLSVDRAVLQALKNPLMHLLRNAVAHGIEPPSQRTAAGKDETGAVRVSFRISGSRLIVRVEDDGGGIDTARLAEAAHRLKLSEGDENAPTSDIIFKAGFTTCTHADSIAGRGIGLSDVAETVERMQGEIEVESTPGVGTSFELRVALSIASHHLLLVRCADDVFGIPVHDVERLMRISLDGLKTVEGWPVVNVEGKPLRVIWLPQLLGAEAQPTEVTKTLALAVVRCGEDRIAIAADGFIGERDMLICDLHGPLQHAAIYHGAVLLEDGKIAPVLRPAALRLNSRASLVTTSRPPTRDKLERIAATILVVDDSFTTRTLEKGLLESHGYRVLVATHGEEALAQLQRNNVDLVFTDIEMPCMDGFALLERIRNHPRHCDLPVVIVTSIQKQEQQQRASELGANAYVVKQRFDRDDLLETIERLLQSTVNESREVGREFSR